MGSQDLPRGGSGEGAAAIGCAGIGLFTGAPAAVTFTRAEGPVTLARAGGQASPIAALTRLRTVLSTGVRLPDGAEILTVEHLFAALAGLGIRSGVAITVTGPEVPLVDGRARAFAEALLALVGRRPPEPPPLRVSRLAQIVVDDSTYRFAPSDGVVVAARFEHPATYLVPDARFEGSPEHFLQRIAPARTFATEEDLARYAARGVRGTVDPSHLVVLTKTGLLAAGEPANPEEPAQHKLLDLLGDLYLHGGPFLGQVSARRPGHARTHEALQRARAEGILVAAS